MNNINYDDILSRLSRIRQDNLRTQDNRKSEIYGRFPRIQEIDNTIAHTSIEASRKRIRRQPVDEDALAACIADLKAEKNPLWMVQDIHQIISHPYTTVICVKTPDMSKADHVHVSDG